MTISETKTTNGTTTASDSTSSSSPSLSTVCAELNHKITSFLASSPKTDLIRRTQEQTKTSLSVISDALDRYSFGELAISYNGGKDCLVLLLLFLCSLSRHPSTSTISRHIHSVYVMSSHPFAEVDAFVDSTAQTYCLDLARYALPMKAAFETYLSQQGRNVKAIFVGTRRTDPHGELLTHFDVTDHGWPSFMRVHPVIDWHYQEVWTFLRALEVPYCKLYDMGYTSLGGTTDTHPNPVLLEKKGAEGHFRPAYELVEDEQERLGRDR